MILAITIATFMNVSYAKSLICNSTWDITARGIKIGVTSEKFINYKDTFEITSHFKLIDFNLR